MRLLKEKYDGLQEISTISRDLKTFLLKPNIQEALQNNDFNTLYKELPSDYASYFTHLMSSLNIDPLKYLDYIPDLFLADTTIRAINIPPHIKRIGRAAFLNCSRLEHITIPDSVMTIGFNAFYKCSGLTSATIGNGVMGIGSWAFEHCINLMSINYMGTKDQWSKINLEIGWNRVSSIKTIHCADGDIEL